MGSPELLGGFARGNGENHPLAHAFPQVKKIRHRIVSRKPPRNSGVTSNLGPFSCKRAQKMGRQGTSIANGKIGVSKWMSNEARAHLKALPAPQAR